MTGKQTAKIYITAVAIIALAHGFSDVLLANYFKDAYDVTAMQRGFIEVPRELPGILAIFAITFLSRLGDVKIAMVAHIISAVGILILAFTTPSFYAMTAVLFVFSMGVHMFMPLQDSIAMKVMGSDSNVGTSLGRLKGIATGFSLIAAIIVFFGFRFEVFQLVTEVRTIFVMAGVLLLISAVLLYSMAKGKKGAKAERPKLVIRKEYKFYYILAIMNGVQKQVFLVYAPWVIIEILGRGADTISLLLLISSVGGMFFLPFLGKCLDRFGIRAMFYADALSFIVVYLAFAFMTYQLVVGNFATTGVAAIATFGIFVLDRMSSQMGFIRSVYLNKIAKDKAEIGPTLSFGIALDHVVAISCSLVSGVIWTNYGPHYIFILAASFSLVNLVVAKIMPLKSKG